MNKRIAVRRARFQNTNAVFAIFRQATRHNGSGGSGTNNDVVKIKIAHTTIFVTEGYLELELRGIMSER